MRGVISVSVLVLSLANVVAAFGVEARRTSGSIDGVVDSGCNGRPGAATTAAQTLFDDVKDGMFRSKDVYDAVAAKGSCLALRVAYSVLIGQPVTPS